MLHRTSLSAPYPEHSKGRQGTLEKRRASVRSKGTERVKLSNWSASIEVLDHFDKLSVEEEGAQRRSRGKALTARSGRRQGEEDANTHPIVHARRRKLRKEKCALERDVLFLSAVGVSRRKRRMHWLRPHVKLTHLQENSCSWYLI